jgi:alkanesulfonate monooxygenase SsuD/methylene tetrahydromethanopterin reductase-like flavin-dependent oxidoreductase (luciferase family)
VRFGVYLPNLGAFGSPAVLVELAERAEAAGWDGFFVWDTLTAAGAPVADAQVTLGAAAARTSSVTLGSLVTPLGRRRPWKLAREIAALAELSRGRLVVGCSVGSGHDFAPFPGEVQSGGERAARFVDAVELLRLLLSGEPVKWTQSERSAQVLGQPPASVVVDAFLPTPSVPVALWGGASIRRQAKQSAVPLRRVARMLDGLFPLGEPFDSGLPVTVEEFARAVELAFDGGGPPRGFDLVACGHSASGAHSPLDPARFEAEGATWWLESIAGDSPAEARGVIDAGPPR